jgi:GNAT superfamily N-acetyltransferase
MGKLWDALRGAAGALKKTDAAYKRRASERHSIIVPVAVNGESHQPNGLPYHVTVKQFKPEDNARRHLDDFRGLPNPGEHKLTQEPGVFQGPDGNAYYHIKLHGMPEAYKNVYKRHRGTGYTYPSFQARVTVPKSIYDQHVKSGFTDIRFSDPVYCEGAVTVETLPFSGKKLAASEDGEKQGNENRKPEPAPASPKPVEFDDPWDQAKHDREHQENDDGDGLEKAERKKTKIEKEFQFYKNREPSASTLFRHYKHSPHHPASLALKYIVNVMENRKNYANAKSAARADKNFMDLHQSGGAAEKNSHITIEDLHEFAAAHGKKIARQLRWHKNRLRENILAHASHRVHTIDGRPHVALTRGYKGVFKTGPEHQLHSYGDVENTGFGDTMKHRMVPLDNIWYSYDLGHKNATSQKFGNENEYLVSPHTTKNTSAENVKKIFHNKISHGYRGHTAALSNELAPSDILHALHTDADADVRWAVAEHPNYKSAKQQKPKPLAASELRKSPLAYHGSPNDFESFDTDKAGSQHGTSRGHGIYLSSSKNEAGFYANLRSDPGKGGLYRVDRPSDHEMLHWDLPVAKQPKKVRDAIRGTQGYRDANDRAAKSPGQFLTGEQLKGGEFYGGHRHYLNMSDKEISAHLHQLGIKGIKYQHDDHHNYVVFDPRDAKILSRQRRPGTRTEKLGVKKSQPRLRFPGYGIDDKTSSVAIVTTPRQREIQARRVINYHPRARFLTDAGVEQNVKRVLRNFAPSKLGGAQIQGESEDKDVAFAYGGKYNKVRNPGQSEGRLSAQKRLEYTQAHEAGHQAMDALGHKIGHGNADAVLRDLIGKHFSAEHQSAMHNYLTTVGYKPEKSGYVQEVLNTTRDVLSNPEKRQRFIYHAGKLDPSYSDPNKSRALIQDMKRGWKRVAAAALELRPESGDQRLAASESLALLYKSWTDKKLAELRMQRPRTAKEDQKARSEHGRAIDAAVRAAEAAMSGKKQSKPNVTRPAVKKSASADGGAPKDAGAEKKRRETARMWALIDKYYPDKKEKQAPKKTNPLKKEQWENLRHKTGLNPIHGWISPEGKYRHMDPGETHSTVLARRTLKIGPEDRIYMTEGELGAHMNAKLKEGWIAVGVAGQPSVRGHSSVLLNRRHPAHQKLRSLIADAQNDKNNRAGFWTRDFEIAHVDGSPVQGTSAHPTRPEIGYADANHFVRHGTYAPRQGSEIKKGARGDWKSEGYKILHDKSTPGAHAMQALDSSGRVVGHVVAEDLGDGTMQANIVDVHPEHQRKGLASAMYASLESRTGLRMVPDLEAQSKEGAALWRQKNRGFGKPVKKVETLNKSVYRVPVETGLNHRVHKNPSPGQAKKLFQGAKAEAMRYFGDPNGHLHMWDAHDLTHEQVMTHNGIEHTSDNYAGAGVVTSPEEAERVAQNFLRSRRPIKKSENKSVSHPIVGAPHAIFSVENSPYADKIKKQISHDDAIAALRAIKGGGRAFD